MRNLEKFAWFSAGILFFIILSLITGCDGDSKFEWVQFPEKSAQDASIALKSIAIDLHVIAEHLKSHD